MDPHTGVLPGLKVMVDRATGWKFAWQQSPLAAGPQDVKDGVEDGTKFGGARSRRRQNRRNKSPRRVRQIGVVESSAHRTVPLTRISALSRRTSTFQTPSYISENTVKGHVKSILTKLDAIGRTEAIAIANRRGLIQTS